MPRSSSFSPLPSGVRGFCLPRPFPPHPHPSPPRREGGRKPPPPRPLPPGGRGEGMLNPPPPLQQVLHQRLVEADARVDGHVVDLGLGALGPVRLAELRHGLEVVLAHPL